MRWEGAAHPRTLSLLLDDDGSPLSALSDLDFVSGCLGFGVRGGGGLTAALAGK